MPATKVRMATAHYRDAICQRESPSPTTPRGHQRSLPTNVHKLKSILQIVDRQPAPTLLPILRSQQQGEILALLLGDPDLELSLNPPRK